MEILRRVLIAGLLVILCASIAPVAHAGITKPMNNRGLVGYWSMEDCRGLKATDSSGSGNTGTLTNFALTGTTSNWVSGGAAKRGSCALNFDNTDDYVVTGLTSTISTITISAWIQPNSAGEGGLGRIIDKRNNGGTESIYFAMRTPNNLSFQRVLDGSNGAWDTTGGLIRYGVWSHVVLVYSDSPSSNVPIIYINASPATLSVSSSPTGNPVNNSDPFYIGNRGDTTRTFDGNIDDIRIYNRALTAAEVSSLYNSGASKISGSTTRGLLAHWSMEDCRGLKVTDSSGRGNTGTITNFAMTGTTSNWVSGAAAKRGSCALNFGGTDDYVATATESNFDFEYTSPFTISAWVKPANAVSSMTIVSKTTTNIAARGFSLVGSAGLLQMSISNNAQSAILISKRATATWRANAWVHVTGVYTGSGTASGMTLYMDGSAISTITTADTLAGNTILNDVNLRIGLNTDGTSAPLNGSLDEVRIYNRALTAAEVAALYATEATKLGVSTTTLSQGTTLTSGLVGHWTFDGPKLTSTTALDSSGNSNTASFSGVNGLPRPTAGRLGQGIRLDATDDLVTIADNAILKPTIETISAWVNPRAVTGNQVIVNNGNRNSTWAAYTLKFGVCDGGGSDGKISFTVRSANAAGNSTVTQTDTPVANTWTHVVGVNDGTSLSLYINGALNNTGSGLATYAPSGPIRIGGDADVANANYRYIFNGALDDVRVYNRALTSAEITQLYNLGR